MSIPKELLAAFSQVSVNRFFGFRLLERSAGEAVLSMEIRQEHLQEGGVVHGGIVSALADTAAVYPFFPDLEGGRTMTSIEFKINFVRPVLPERGDLQARSRVIKRGRRIGLCDVEVTQSGVLVAKGSFTYLFSGGSSATESRQA